MKLLEEKNIIYKDGDSYVLKGDLQRTHGIWKLSDELKNVQIPQKVEEVIKQRIENLILDEREVLHAGSAQGEEFMALIVYKLLDRKENKLLSQLRNIAEQHQIIHLSEEDDWKSEYTDTYVFEHALLQQAFYKKLSPHERRLYHSNIARILEHLMKAQNKPIRKLILQIAFHYEQGKESFPASKYYYEAAQSSYLDSALYETAELCEQSLEQIKNLSEDSEEYDRLRIDVTYLLLNATWNSWYGNPEEQQKRPYETFAREAVAAANRIGDKSFIARMKFVLGMILVHSEGVSAREKILNEALVAARDANDIVYEFFILYGLGNTIVYKNLDKGLKLHYQAYELYKKNFETHKDFKTVEIKRQLCDLQSRIGISEFDRGNYGTAIKWLTRSVSAYRENKMLDDLPVYLNYLSQVSINMGMVERSEEYLLESLELMKEHKKPLPWRGYNRALLGKLYLEWNRIEEAVRPIIEGWEETKKTWNVFLVPLVMNFHIGLLMHPNYKKRNIKEAERQIEATLAEVE